jgi:hypothetical protein
MRSQILAAAAFATLVAAMPAFAQTSPGRSAADHARDRAAATRDQFARDVSEFRRMSAKERAAHAAAYRQATEPHRLNALQIAERAKTGPLPPDAGARIRQAFEADLNAWRDAFHIGGREWKAMREQWLVDANALTGEQWALQRANWFTARDAWIAQRLQGQ